MIRNVTNLVFKGVCIAFVQVVVFLLTTLIKSDVDNSNWIKKCPSLMDLHTWILLLAGRCRSQTLRERSTGVKTKTVPSTSARNTGTTVTKDTVLEQPVPRGPSY